MIALSYASQILSKDSAAKLAGLNVEKKFNLQEFPVDKYQVEMGVDTSKGDKSTGNGTNAPPTGKHASEGLDYILNPPCFTDRKVTGTPEGTIEYVALQLGDKVVVYWPTRSAEQVLLKKEFRGTVYKTVSVAINTSGVARYVSVTDEVLEVRVWSENNKAGKYLVRADCLHKVIPNYVKGDMAPEQVFTELSKRYEYKQMDESRIDVIGLESALKELNLMPKNTHLSLHGSEVYSFEQIAEMRVFEEHGYDVAKIATCAEKLAKRGKISLVPIDEELKDFGPKGVMRNQVMALYWALDAQK